MNKSKSSDALDRVNNVFKLVFDDGNIEVDESTHSGDIDGWDSITHISLIVSIEKEFGIRLNAADVGRMANVGEMIELIIKKSQES